MVSIQALIPNRPTLGDAVMAGVKARNIVVDPARLVEADGEAFPSDGDSLPTSLKYMQNCGTNAVKYKIGDPMADANDFHGILAGGTAQDDGLGSVVDLSNIKEAVYVMGVGGAPRLATIKGYYNA